MSTVISPGKGLKVIPSGFRLLAALAQTFPVQSEDLLLQTRQAGHDDDTVVYVSEEVKTELVRRCCYS